MSCCSAHGSLGGYVGGPFAFAVLCRFPGLRTLIRVPSEPSSVAAQASLVEFAPHGPCAAYRQTVGAMLGPVDDVWKLSDFSGSSFFPSSSYPVRRIALTLGLASVASRVCGDNSTGAVLCPSAGCAVSSSGDCSY